VCEIKIVNTCDTEAFHTGGGEYSSPSVCYVRYTHKQLPPRSVAKHCLPDTGQHTTTRTNFAGRPVFKNFIFFECNASDDWSSILREEHRLGVLDNAVVVKIFVPKKHEVTVDRKIMYKMKDFMICTPHQILFSDNQSR
jgi:hypothetical protein